MMTILPNDLERLRAILSGAWPVPRIFGGTARPVKSFDVPERLVHHHDKETPDDADK